MTEDLKYVIKHYNSQIKVIGKTPTFVYGKNCSLLIGIDSWGFFNGSGLQLEFTSLVDLYTYLVSQRQILRKI